MKLFKITKSVNYVTYPAYRELVKIRGSVTDAMKSLKDLLMSLIAGYIVNNSIIIKAPITCFRNSFPEMSKIIIDFLGSEFLSLLLYVIISATCFYIVKFVSFVASMKNNNKDTNQKREQIRYAFYNVAIPLLIEGKSIIEQYEEDKSDEKKKKLLLLLQAYNCMEELYTMLFSFKVIERDKTGEQTPNSCEVYENIGRCAYDTLVAEMLDNICKLYGYLIIESREKTIAERDSLKAMLNSHGVFDEVESLQIDLAQAKNICRENE